MTLKNTKKADTRIAPDTAIGELPVIPVTDAALSAATEWEDKRAEAAQRSPFYEIAPLGVTFASTPADALIQVSIRGKRDPYNPSLLQVGDTSIDIGDATGKKKLGVGASKMLNAATCAFTAANNEKQDPPTLGVYIDTADYARKNGVEIEARQMPTPEEQAAEDKRADTDAHNFLAKTRRNLINLSQNTSFTWTERTKKRVEAYSQITFISAFKVTRKSIYVEFGLSAARYLITRHQRSLPDALFLVDENRENAYSIGNYLNELYSQDGNVLRSVEGLTSISHILEHTSYPTIESIRTGKSKSKRTWRDLIKERLENDLDYLRNIGVLTTWEYSYSKKRILTDDEAANISTYEEFAALYLHYEIANYPPHKERVKEIAAKREEQKASQRAKNKQRKTKTEGGK